MADGVRLGEHVEGKVTDSKKGTVNQVVKAPRSMVKGSIVEHKDQAPKP